LLARRYLLTSLAFLIQRSKNQWDDILFEKHVFDRFSHLAPALVVYVSASLLPPDQYALTIDLIRRFALIYITIVCLRGIDSVLKAVIRIYRTHDMERKRPIKGYVQAVKVIVYLFALILIVAIVIDRSPVLLLSGLGALTAVLILVFRDSILGFVAGIQLAGNNLVEEGDWISVPKSGADGTVIDVTLTTVKVQNWDMTITNVPIYSLVADAFTNWRGMQESGGRRIKRALMIDMNTIRFCDDSLLERFEKMKIISDYIRTRRGEIEEQRKSQSIPTEDVINGPRLTNVGVFRNYMQAYIKNHAKINQDMTAMVRQLPPGEKGLPIEIYCFSSDKRWAFYEQLQADIFDHLLAVIDRFDLGVFQEPSGRDIRALVRASSRDEQPAEEDA
jgi:miniconductance mechanosensitive channel